MCGAEVRECPLDNEDRALWEKLERLESLLQTAQRDVERLDAVLANQWVIERHPFNCREFVCGYPAFPFPRGGWGQGASERDAIDDAIRVNRSS